MCQRYIGLMKSALSDQPQPSTNRPDNAPCVLSGARSKHTAYCSQCIPVYSAMKQGQELLSRQHYAQEGARLMFAGWLSRVLEPCPPHAA